VPGIGVVKLGADALASPPNKVIKRIAGVIPWTGIGASSHVNPNME